MINYNLADYIEQRLTELKQDLYNSENFLLDEDVSLIQGMIDAFEECQNLNV